MNGKNYIAGIMILFGLTVAVLIIVLGLILVVPAFYNKMIAFKSMPTEFRTIIGVVLIGYGVLRSVIIFQKRKDTEE